MAKNPETVINFLKGITYFYKPLWNKEKEAMLKLKAAESKKMNLEFNGKLGQEDLG